MHLFGLVFSGFIAIFWLTHGLRVAYGATRLPWVKNFAPAAYHECPRISILFAARDEEEKLPAALAALVEMDYPNLEFIAGENRWEVATGLILDVFAAAHSRLLVVHITDTPAGDHGGRHY